MAEKPLLLYAQMMERTALNQLHTERRQIRLPALRSSIIKRESSQMPILPATLSDIPQLLLLINGAFRGDSARQGWTHESDLLAGGIRTDEPILRDIIQRPGAVLLKYCNEVGGLEGCVFLEKKERGLYLGMLTVKPELQGAGIGKKLLAAAEIHAHEQGCRSIYMTVFSARPELVAWYERHGYRRTGETKPFEADQKFGVPTQPLEFVVLEKAVE
jgi:ribosomal protein S18 acetylase RimI-like enzyme